MGFIVIFRPALESAIAILWEFRKTASEPVLRKIDNRRLRAMFAQFIKKRRSLEVADRIAIHSASASLAKIVSMHLLGRRLNVAIRTDGKSAGANVRIKG